MGSTASQFEIEAPDKGQQFSVEAPNDESSAVANRPGMPAFKSPMHKAFMIGEGDPEDPSNTLEGKVKGLAKSAYQISIPGVATSLLQKKAPELASQLPGVMTQNAAPADELPGKIIGTEAPMMVGDDVPPMARAEESAPRAIGKPAPESPVEGPGMIGRLAKVGIDRIPGVKLARDVVGAIKGPEPPPSPAPPPAPIPETNGVRWGTGGQAPVEQWGKMTPPETPEPQVAKPNTSPKAIQSQINDSLGGRPLQPGVKLRDQGKMQPPPSAAISDLKPVDSTAVKAYKYDPDKREFTATSASGQTFIHGDVSPEQARAFEKATSKGKAWNDIRNNSPLVGKVVNGQRINHAPSIRSASPNDAMPE